MRKLSYFTVIAFMLTLIACSNDENSTITWDIASGELVRSGVELPHRANEFSLRFTDASAANATANSSVDWLTPYIIYDNGEQATLKVYSEKNDDTTTREGIITLYVGGKTTRVKVLQVGVPSAVTDKEVYYSSAEGGKMEVVVDASGELTAELHLTSELHIDIEGDDVEYPNPAEEKWAEITATTLEASGKYRISLSISENKGFGRIATLLLKVRGEYIVQDLGPCIVQSPAPFADTVVVKTTKVGSLPILLGRDITNLRRIRSLTVSGYLNGLDFHTLRKLVVTSPDSAALYPISIDLSECGIEAGNRNSFYGLKDFYTDFPHSFLAQTLPKGVFTDAANLVSIKLPKGLKTIGMSAFENCTALQSIAITDEVEEIGYKAFMGCTGLNEISMSASSIVSSIGTYAFTTGSTLNTLYLPGTLYNISEGAFLGCKAMEVHVNWEEPMELNVVPWTEGSKLYVPKGTAELYRNARNWKRFEYIYEE